MYPEPLKPKKRSFYSYIWDTWDKPREERKFLAKLDACLLTYATLSYFSKYLDQQSITNAYVSGMQDDLHLHGNQFNIITTSWTIGYVISQIPSNLLITRIRPSIWVPALEIIWSILTIVLASAKNFSQVCVLRFFIGLSGGPFYPAMSYVIGSWYQSEELAKRSCILHTSAAIGPIFSGFLQAAAYNGLNGVGGLAGWRWLFIIDGIITVPIGLFGFLVMPDLPHSTRPSFIYTEKELVMAQKRMDLIGRKPPAKFTKAKVKGFFKSWHLYVLVTLFIFYNNSRGPANSMIFWLKSFNTEGHTKYTVSQINIYPLGINVVQIIATLIWAWWSDAIEKRWPPVIVAGTLNIIVCIVLASTPLYTNIARRWAFYYMTQVTNGLSGIVLSWTNELTGYDSEKRAFVIGCCNSFAYVFEAWLPIVLFPQVDQPRVFVGNVATIFINVGMICAALVTLYFQNRDARRSLTVLDIGSTEKQISELQENKE
ncbi:MFS general substrate transporter [Desarmillaria tabescens]|uniref:MFS general substrate transporter n=1 Tax=Armillaria tabescens TaxID=1929756 RepID=A0AA39K9L6_ARMTA|nr:MFS general substrate transporter [Desarmillaria tabescens]KAK0457109.1 MFS general substrate transporter [Desarmillaria tabescens]